MRYHNWTISMLEDLTKRLEAGATLEEVFEYARAEYDGFKSTLSAVKTALRRYKVGMYIRATDGSDRVILVNRHPKERETRFRGLTDDCADLLRKAQAAALDAVSLYNRPSLDENDFRSHNYIILMVIAWTSLFHAILLKRGVRPYYKEPSPDGSGDRETERMWELRECLRAYHESDNPPTRANLLFLADLRDRIEHRHLPALDEAVFGECQACLLNFEKLLTEQFGSQFSMNVRLVFALQFGHALDDRQIEAMRNQQRFRSRDVLASIDEWRGRLPEQLLGSQDFSFRVLLVPKLTGSAKSHDAAVEFVRIDPKDPTQLEKYQALLALTRDRHVPVANLDTLGARQVAEEVESRIGRRFSTTQHTRCWQKYGVRPPTKGPDPAATNPKYCIWDKRHRDYSYTRAWVDFLSTELRDPEKYAAILVSKAQESPLHQIPIV